MATSELMETIDTYVTYIEVFGFLFVCVWWRVG